MLLTKDNLLRFVQQQKYTTPTIVAKEFETTTTIASAALGELTNGGGLGSTHIKYGTTPYYYDLKQQDCLIEIAQKSFTDTELELFTKIKNEQIVSLNTLTIPQRAIMSKLKDIYYEIQVKGEDKTYTFLIWFLREKKTTQQQIEDAILGGKKTKTTATSSSNSSTTKSNSSNDINSNSNSNISSNNQFKQNNTHSNPFSNLYSGNNGNNSNNNSNSNNQQNNTKNQQSNNISSNVTNPSNQTNNSKSLQNNSSGNSSNNNNNKELSSSNTINMTQTNFDCDKYLYQNGYTILEKEKHELGFLYKISIQLNEFTLFMDALYTEQKKIQLKQILEFYTSSMKPKIIFHTSISKKIESTIKEFENCMIVEVKN